MIDFVELMSDPNTDFASINPLPSSEIFLDFLRKRALDESVYVRKNALQVSKMKHISCAVPNVKFRSRSSRTS